MILLNVDVLDGRGAISVVVADLAQATRLEAFAKNWAQLRVTEETAVEILTQLVVLRRLKLQAETTSIEADRVRLLAQYENGKNEAWRSADEFIEQQRGARRLV